jgi:hypothetical protein
VDLRESHPRFRARSGFVNTASKTH